MIRVPLTASLILLAGTPLAAQSFHTVSSSRQRSDERELNVSIEFAAGRFRLGRDASGALYRSRMSYDEARFSPLAEYADGELRLGLENMSVQGGDLRKHEYDRQSMEVNLSPAVPTRLDLKFVAGEADVDLGGLNLQSADIHTGASQSRVRFSSPTVGECESLSFQVGAAEFRGEQLGNSRCQTFDFAGGAGDLALDFTGNWGETRSVTADIKMGVGTLRLDLPRDVGVEVEMTKFLSSFDRSGFVKRGDTYYSRNWESARTRIHMDITTALGSIEVAWR